ncbi:uncharacterized protein LOC125502314 isoform X2 [Dendroctonus ponderosae]|uniref:Uncharacterized protein n=1 Tax=Dendroctonus ponderosae TaxID=77166 RepID=A0AAR5P306_DENPD|nr:uncharacterized protein LOC109534324 isoform X2 [Dendroctonus ponderosae]XP_048519228.1 uncharacterized protein LOC125502314 isoform X2 [Dendroctonus ponderosae]
MEEKPEISPSESTVPESPRPTAFTIDFGNEKKVDLQRHKSLAEKFQQRHKRGKSMSKLEGSSVATPTATKRHPLTGNLPRKSSFHSEDEKVERCKSASVSSRRSDLTLPLANTTSDRMTHSFPNAVLFSLNSPTSACDLQNVSSPEFEMISPFSPGVEQVARNVNDISLSSDEAIKSANFNIHDLDWMDRQSDTLSETGTYTLEGENYSEEQKARMSIDNEFKIEKLTVEEKTEEYIKSLSVGRFVLEEANSSTVSSQYSGSSSTVSSLHSSFSAGGGLPPVPPLKPSNEANFGNRPLELLLKAPPAGLNEFATKKVLSPILSPTQNISIGDEDAKQRLSPKHQPLTKSMPSNAKSQKSDEGAIISVTSSGAFRGKSESKQALARRLSLTKSEIHVEAYIDGKMYNEGPPNNTGSRPNSARQSKLTANIVNVQSIEVNPHNSGELGNVVSASFTCGKTGNVATVTTGLPPTPTGKLSPSKIPSPIHTLARPRSRNSLSAPPDDFDTEMILKPTRNYINSLQHKLSLDNSDQDSDYEMKYGLQLNNTAHLLKQRALHIRHNSLDDRTINNKLEHFQSKNLQPIDQTYTNVFDQYHKQNKVMNKINNSPSNSPIRRSSSFSNRNQINNIKSSNVALRKDSNLSGSPCLSQSERIQRSSSTACIKPNYAPNRGAVLEHKKIDRNQFGDTESSSEEELEPVLQKKKDLGSLSNTRCNRTFSLRRARVDNEANKLKCPNTPDMRRKTFQPTGGKPERAISVDRKPVRTNETQSRYLLSLNKRATSLAKEIPKSASKSAGSGLKPAPSKTPASFARSEAGRFSMRSSTNGPMKGAKKDGKGSKQGGGARCNSSLSSREVEFQNWKRRKSYDPMKAAAEGKKKDMEKRASGLAKLGAVSPDSSPSHSGSVHRSQIPHP